MTPFSAGAQPLWLNKQDFQNMTELKNTTSETEWEVMEEREGVLREVMETEDKGWRNGKRARDEIWERDTEDEGMMKECRQGPSNTFILATEKTVESHVLA